MHNLQLRFGVWAITILFLGLGSPKECGRQPRHGIMSPLVRVHVLKSEEPELKTNLTSQLRPKTEQ